MSTDRVGITRPSTSGGQRVWFWRCEVCTPPVMEQQESEMQAGLSGILHWNLVHDATADDTEAASHIILWDQPALADSDPTGEAPSFDTAGKD